MNSLNIIIRAFFDICRLRLGPQDLPVSKTLLGLTLIIYTFISLVLSLIQISLAKALLSAIIDTGLLIVLIGSLLYFASRFARFTQTITALAGINILFGIPTVPLVFLIGQKGLSNNQADLLVLLLFVVVIWNFIVYAHILRNSLEIPMFASFALTILISILTFSVLNQIIPMVK